MEEAIQREGDYIMSEEELVEPINEGSILQNAMELDSDPGEIEYFNSSSSSDNYKSS